jgi:hypothetical protein
MKEKQRRNLPAIRRLPLNQQAGFEILQSVSEAFQQRKSRVRSIDPVLNRRVFARLGSNAGHTALQAWSISGITHINRQKRCRALRFLLD